jgi:hypothetical protein
MTSRPKSAGQVRTIFGEAKRRGLDNEALHELVADVLYSTGSGSNRLAVPDALGQASPARITRDALGEASQAATRSMATASRAVSIAALTYAEAERVIQRLKGRSFVPLRTLQYRRKRAGVQQIITPDHEKKIAALASQRHWSAESLVNFCKRQCGHHPLRTTADANKVIEALKSMNKREGLWAA